MTRFNWHNLLTKSARQRSSFCSESPKKPDVVHITYMVKAYALNVLVDINHHCLRKYNRRRWSDRYSLRQLFGQAGAPAIATA
jgi:hypothetical protein